MTTYSAGLKSFESFLPFVYLGHRVILMLIIVCRCLTRRPFVSGLYQLSFTRQPLRTNSLAFGLLFHDSGLLGQVLLASVIAFGGVARSGLLCLFSKRHAAGWWWGKEEEEESRSGNICIT